MTEVSSILKDGRIYAAANIVNRAAGLALIPVFTNVLTPGEFGLYSIIQSVGDLFSILVGLGFTGAMNRLYLEFPDDEGKRRCVVSTALLCVLGIAVLGALLSFPLAHLVVWGVFGAQEHAPLFFVAFISLLFVALFEVECSYSVVCKAVWTYFWLSVGKAVLLIGLSLLLVVSFGWGVKGVVYANALTFGVLALLRGAMILRRVGLGFSKDLAGQLVRFGIPLVPSAFANGALGVVERYFLNNLAGTAAVGMYSLGSRLASLLQMFVAAPFSQTFSVRRMESLVKGEDQQGNDRILTLFVVLISLCALCLAMFSPDLIALIAPGDYAEAASLLPLLGLCAVLASINFNIELGIHFSRRTWVLPLISVLALVACAVANALLIGWFGVIGCALALLVVNVLRLVVTAALNLRFGACNIRPDWGRIVLVGALTLAAGEAVVRARLPALDPLWVGAKLLVFGVLCAGIVVSPVVDPRSRAELRTAFGRFSRQGGGS